MKYFILVLVLFQTSLFVAQDVDVYKKGKNDNYKLPNISPEMTYEEFELLSQNVRMKDMMYASIVPGYIHFKTQEKRQGYWLLGLRSASYITMGGLVLGNKDNLFHINKNNLDDKELKKLNQNQTAFYAALALASTTYLYDVLHGDWILHQKQEKIRYKYAIKASRVQTYLEKSSLYPAIAFSVQF